MSATVWNIVASDAPVHVLARVREEAGQAVIETNDELLKQQLIAHFVLPDFLMKQGPAGEDLKVELERGTPGHFEARCGNLRLIGFKAIAAP